MWQNYQIKLACLKVDYPMALVKIKKRGCRIVNTLMRQPLKFYNSLFID